MMIFPVGIIWAWTGVAKVMRTLLDSAVLCRRARCPSSVVRVVVVESTFHGLAGLGEEMVSDRGQSK
jgi:hypothetical protein